MSFEIQLLTAAYFTWLFFIYLFLRAKKEVDDVIGMKKDISYDDLGKLVYLSQVHWIME